MRFIVLTLAAALVAGCAERGTFDKADGGGCVNPDHLASETGGSECMALATFPSKALGAQPLLVVMLEGDGGGDNLAQWGKRVIADSPAFNRANAVLVAIARPGERLLDNRSSGERRYGSGGYSDKNVRNLMDAVARLKRHYGAHQVVGIGQSGGSALLALGIALYPENAPDTVLLSACPCDLEGAADRRNAQIPAAISRYRITTPVGMSPMIHAHRVPEGKVVVAVNGSRDDRTPPMVAEGYIDKLQTRGIDARLVVAEGADHGNTVVHQAFLAELAKLVPAGK